ncbi:putative quinol monooxygenase [Dyella sp. C11]|uniref:putative quinol monooxygenase n=1 Tax=Dyella sp. C11 TaxID=2126991 RepID=UPI001E4D84FE|nr:putative quinol monooxygenase [Dyella sp. C11]
MIKVVAVLAARPGRTTELKALLDQMLASSRAESGNLRYDLWQDIEDPGRFLLDELYLDDDALLAHRSSPHFQDYLSRINDLADRTAAAVRALNVDWDG